MRLVAFGCSLTYGYALSDTGEDWKTQPSKMSWPFKLAESMNIPEVINLGSPGASNKKILHLIQNFNFEKDDIVFILWSHIERFCIIRDPYNKEKGYDVEHIAPHIKTKNSQYYFTRMYNENDHLIAFYTYANYVKMLLESKNIQNYQLTVKPYHDSLTFDWNNVKFLKTSLETDIRRSKEIFNDHARDGSHPGVKAHKKFAELIYKEIQGS